MATIESLNVEQLRQHLISGGFLDSFTDIFGSNQPAPKTQMNELDLTTVRENDRVVMIRNTGGVTNSDNYQYDVRNMLIIVVGIAGESDSIIANGLAIDMHKYLQQNFTSDCIFNIVSRGVTGPFTMPDSRRAYEINLQVSFAHELS